MMMAFNRIRQLFMVYVLVTIQASANHAGVDDTSTGLSQFQSLLPLSGFSRTGWGVKVGEADFYLGRLKVIGGDHVVIQKLFAEMGTDSSPSQEGLRAFIDQFQVARDKENRQVISAHDIYLGCRENPPCSKTFQTDEKEILAGFDSIKFFGVPVNTTKQVKGGSFPLMWLEPENTIVGTINGVNFGGFLQHPIRESYFEAEHLALMDEYLISLDFQSTGVGADRTFSGVVKADGVALVKFQIVKQMDLDEGSIGSWSVKLSDVNSQEVPNKEIQEKTKAVRLGGIALLQLFSQLIPMTVGFNEKSQLSLFVDAGISLEVNFSRVNPDEIDYSNRDLEAGPYTVIQRTKFKVWHFPKSQAF